MVILIPQKKSTWKIIFKRNLLKPLKSIPKILNHVSSKEFSAILFNIYLFSCCIHVGVLSACMSAHQKKASDPIEVQLYTVLSCHVGAEN